MALIVQKYGGSSLATPKHIRLAADRISQLRRSGVEVVVVVSAMGHTTDHLIKLAGKTVKTPPSRELDMLLTAGERVSMSLLAMCLQEKEVPAISFTGSQSGILTTAEHTKAKIIEIRPQRIQEELKKGKVVIIAGFQGVSLEKEITTLGRGGSDTTAVALAAALKADRCEILTDVEGIFSADPRIVPGAKPFDFLTYDECLELSSLGAKMQPRSIELAKKFGVSVWIGSSHSNRNQGTRVGNKNEEVNSMENTVIKGVATKDGYHCFASGFKILELGELLQKSGAVLRFFSLGEKQCTFLVEESESAKTESLLKNANAYSNHQKNVSIVSLVGEAVSSNSELLPRCLKILESLKAEVLLMSSNSLSLTVAVPSEQKAQVAQAFHSEFVEK